MCLNSRNSQMAQKGLTFDEINPFTFTKNFLPKLNIFSKAH